MNSARKEEVAAGTGEFAECPAFDADHVHRLLQQACRSLEAVEEHAAAAYVAHAMSIVTDHYALSSEQSD